MTPRKPDPALTRALAELRGLRSADRIAILELLEPVSRLRVERLLGGRDDGRRPASRNSAVAFERAGYSPWLLAHLQSNGESGGMTAAGLNLLRDSAQARHGMADALRDTARLRLGERFSALFRRRSAA